MTLLRPFDAAQGYDGQGGARLRATLFNSPTCSVFFSTFGAARKLLCIPMACAMGCFLSLLTELAAYRIASARPQA